MNIKPESPEDVGLWPDLSRTGYDALAGLNKSRLYRLIEDTPAHYRWELDHPQEVETPAMRLGALVHKAVLEPERFAAECISCPPPPSGDVWNRRLKEHRAAWAAFDAEHPSADVLDAEMRCRVEAMRDAVLAHSLSAEYLAAAQKEVSFQWRDPETVILCKGRADGWIANAGIVFDLKTSQSANPRAFGYAAYKTGGVFQLAFYDDGIHAVAEAPRRDPRFIVVESSPPHVVAVRGLDREQVEIGRWQYRRALERVRDCEAAGCWPGYGEGVLDMVLPAYAGMELDPVGGMDLPANTKATAESEKEFLI